MKTSSTMTRDVVMVSPDATLDTAQRLMDGWRIRHLPVVEGNELVGILSDRDVLRCAGGARARCRDAMTAAPLTCRPSTDVARVAAMMIEQKIDSVPVVDEAGALIGLVTSSDLLELLARDDAAQACVLPFEFRLRAANDGDLAAALA
jgi:CBS domain-containing protein